jgi:hypothetical protein
LLKDLIFWAAQRFWVAQSFQRCDQTFLFRKGFSPEATKSATHESGEKLCAKSKRLLEI